MLALLLILVQAGPGESHSSGAYVDADGDGIVALGDQCPSEPEDRDGIQDDDGCPETDADGDGVLDEADRCPLQGVRGQPRQDGCPGWPDDEPEDAWAQRARLRAARDDFAKVCEEQSRPEACHQAGLHQAMWLDQNGPQWQKVHPSFVKACAGGVVEACALAETWEPASRGYWPLPQE